MKAIILTRVSTKEQEEGHSLNAQNLRLIEYAKRKNLTVIKQFEIIESSTRGNRKKFQEVIDFCLAQPEKVALVADAVDRVQRSFKESVMLDDLVRRDKIELHFYRENMIIGAQATASDIMRWDFSVMGAKSYVLQLSENVRRSLDYKLRNGEKAGSAPTGYVNYRAENGKNSIKPDEDDAEKVKYLLNLYALGGTSAHELTRIAEKLGLRSHTGRKLGTTSILHILRNPFYYGEMLVKGELHAHIYAPLISKDTYDTNQKILEKSRANPFKKGEIPFMYRGLIKCANTGKTCMIEIKKAKGLTYVVCWSKEGKRVYIQQKDIDDQIYFILKSIKIPDELVSDLQQQIKGDKKQEIAFRNAETGRLKAELTRIDERIDALLNMRLDGEIDKESYQAKKNALELQRHRAVTKIAAHGKADDGFNETVLNLMDISKSAAEIFATSTNTDKKRFLLSFLFDRLELNEGRLGYELRFPFDAFQTELEPSKSGVNSGKNSSRTAETTHNNVYELEPQKTDKKQGLKPKFKSSVQYGWGGWTRTSE